MMRIVWTIVAVISIIGLVASALAHADDLIGAQVVLGVCLAGSWFMLGQARR